MVWGTRTDHTYDALNRIACRSSSSLTADSTRPSICLAGGASPSNLLREQPPLRVRQLLACDPVFDYEPENWEPSGAYSWEHRSDKFDLQTHSLGGIVGSKGLSLTLEVTNRADQPLVLEEALLLAEDKKPYQADLPDELKWRTVGAKQSGWLDLFWEWDKQATEVLGERAQLTLRFLHGEEASEVRIQFRRVE
ncbi:MAG: hypothetical protein V3T83_01440 [Acidobacteriota bacterium]